MTQRISGGWVGQLGSAGIEPQGTAPRPDTEALHQRDADVVYPVPLPPLPRPAVARIAPATDAERDAQVQRELDAFRQSMNPPYVTPAGLVWSGTTFQMSKPYDAQRASIAANRAVVAAAAQHAHLSQSDLQLVLSGRGTPGAIRALTQALIDGGHVPGDADPVTGVRKMMFDCGIGIDCAGYVQQAYLRAMGVSAAAVGLRAPTNEDLSDLGAAAFTRVTDLARVRPGDIVALGPPQKQPGHRAIVYEQHVATDAEIAALRENDTGRDFTRRPPIRVLTVDSSWGSNGDPRYGGVRRESWWYCEATHQWGWFEQGDEATRRFSTASTPMAHPFDGPFGIFRGRAAVAPPDRRTPQ
jgi:hypothetical protein